MDRAVRVFPASTAPSPLCSAMQSRPLSFTAPGVRVIGFLQLCDLIFPRSSPPSTTTVGIRSSTPDHSGGHKHLVFSRASLSNLKEMLNFLHFSFLFLIFQQPCFGLNIGFLFCWSLRSLGLFHASTWLYCYPRISLFWNVISHLSTCLMSSPLSGLLWSASPAGVTFQPLRYFSGESFILSLSMRCFDLLCPCLFCYLDSEFLEGTEFCLINLAMSSLWLPINKCGFIN